MGKKIIVLVIFSMLSMYTYAQEKRVYWDNGNLKSVSNYKDGEKEGMWETYYEDGRQEGYGRYIEGKEDGAWREYYFNGKTKRVRQFNDGVLSGYMSYYINGKLQVTGLFDDAEKKHGNWQQFYENRELKLNGEYRHGERHGKWKFYNDTGNIYKIENYNGGLKMSKWEANVDGGIELITRSAYGKLNGEWKFYNEDGKCIETGNYRDDEKDGTWTYYYTNGQLNKVQIMDEGKLMEVVSYFDNKGTPLDRGTLKNGDGTVKEYSLEGVATVVEYANGEVIDWDNYTALNSLAWEVYENESDNEKLENAIKWVKHSIELDKNYYNSDTYAALLYKTGNYKEALVIAQEAIVIAKETNDDFSVTAKLIENINTKLKKTIKR